jgi:uncharacterized repeat protein (TIGR01451 family)
MRTTSQSTHRHVTAHGQRGRRQVIAAVLVGLAILFGVEPAFADQFYFTRTRALADAEQGATGLFLWNDATGAQSQIGGDGSYLRHATNGPIPVDGLATNLAGTLYGFAIDDASTAGFIPWDAASPCTATHQSRLVSINVTTGVVSYVGPWLTGRHINGAAFDSQGRLWGIDCSSDSIVQISPASGTIVGTPIAAGMGGSTTSDIDFAANGMGIIGYGGLQFRVFDPDAGWVANVPITAVNNGFDGTLTPPYAIAGIAFTSNLSARNGSPQADACRLNLVEGRGTDELGHGNDPFFANPVIAHKEVNQYDPPNRPAAFYNGGPGDGARVGGPALPDCFYDWGDAPNSYGTLRTGNGAQHAIVADGAYLGAGQPDFEVDGEPNAGATGDDGAGTDDEDGVVIPVLPTGMTAQIQVAAGNVGPGTRLQGWIDWAGDGSFAQAGDQILVDAAVTAGTNTFGISVPATATVGTTTARFRIANQVGLGFLGPAGSGEVEDYQVQVTTGETDLAITKTDGSSTYSPGFDATYTIVVSNNGPGAALGARVSDPLPPGISSANWTCGLATGGGVCGAVSGTGAIDTTADLPVGASITYTLSLGIPVSYTGNLTNTATVTSTTGITDTNLDNNDASDTNTMEPPPTSGACAPLRVVGNTTFSLAPFAINGTVQKSGAPNGWMPSSPWTTLGGNYTFTWTFSQPVPANWIRFVVSDVGHTAYQTTPARFSIALGAGSAATPADFSLVSGWHDTFTDMPYNASTGVMTFVPTGGVKQAGALQGNSTDMVTSITITGTNVNLGDYIVNLLYVRPSCLTLEKVSEGGVGPFTIDMTNVAEADGTVVPSTTLTTTTPGTPVAAAMLFFSPVPGAVMAMTEVVPPGWNNTAAMCTDQNAGVTGNPTVIGNFVSPTITIPDSNVRPEADIHCVFTNQLLPAADLAVVKTVAPNQVFSGQQVVYTLQVTNNGPESADGALLTDPQPVGLDCSAGTLTCGSAAGGAVCPPSPTIAQLQGTGLPIPTLPMSGSVAFTLTCTVTASGQP